MAKQVPIIHDKWRGIAMIYNVYTFDETIYNGNSSRDFYRFCRRENKRLAKYLPAQVLYSLLHKLGVISETKWQEKFFSFLADIKDVDAQVGRFWQDHEKNIKTWFPDYRRNDDVLISVSPAFFAGTHRKETEFYPHCHQYG